MSFTTVEFFIFIIAGLIIYYMIPGRFQWIWLLVMSYAYYFTFSVKTAVFLAVTTLITYTSGIVLEKIYQTSDAYLTKNKAVLDKDAKKAYKKKVKKQKKMVVAIALVGVFGILGVFKYLNFVLENVNRLTVAFGQGQFMEPISLLLPLGISFYTFQSASYVIDMYHAKYPAQKNILKYALFVSFFPQILQGPIGRYDRLSEQLYKGHRFVLTNLHFGSQRILWGFFKKMVLADRVSGYVTTVFSDCQSYGGFYNICAILFYSIQLYADFSGGMDIVIGTAQMFGIEMDENFRQPYFSKSVGEFWRRWHITLGAWMKDYVFYPFSLSKAMQKFGKFSKKTFKGQAGKALPVCLGNILVFFLVGIWHGAYWKYVAYGMYNGIIIAVSALLEPTYAAALKRCHINPEAKAWKFFQIVRTFIMVNIGLYFDMTPGLLSSFTMMKESITKLSLSQLGLESFIKLGMSRTDLIIFGFGCVVLLVVSILKERGVHIRESVAKRPLPVRWLCYYALIIGIIMLGATKETTGFLYANF